MAPQAKRRRSSSGVLEDVQDSSEGFPAIENLKLREEFQFEDASIVLATDVHLYRVHKSILAKSSTVFKDMLGFPMGGAGATGDGAGTDLWDGLPLVRMVGDSDEGIYHLLMTLYDHEYFHASKPLKFRAVLSLLQLSTKYDIPVVRRKVLRHMENFYPTALEKWSRTAIESFQRNAVDVPEDRNFMLLAAARQCNAKTILPVLFYECATQSLDVVLSASKTVTSEDLGRIIIGRERLIKLLNELGVLALDPRENCRKDFCHEMRLTMFVEWMDVNTDRPAVFPLDACTKGLGVIIDGDVLESICDPCKNKASVNLKEFRETVWDSLPGIFGLASWHSLKNAQVSSV